MHGDFKYEGSELELFSRARNWKNYWGRVIENYLGARVLDVGAGLGATAEHLCGVNQSLWLALEPDEKLANCIRLKKESGAIPVACEVLVGTVTDLSPFQKFDTILYVDVLEHIAHDYEELLRAANHVEVAGYLAILAPAHQRLFTPFDKAVGHFRRYNLETLGSLIPPGFTTRCLVYLDSVGLVASLGNRYVLRSKNPSAFSIKVWDSCMVPLSRVLDPIIGYRIGKSILAVFQKNCSG